METTNQESRPPQGAPHDWEVLNNKTLRVAIDSNIQGIKALPASRERSLAITKLQEAVMWLGMDLKAINDESGGAENPYPHSKDPTTTIIDQTADGLKL